MAVLKFTKMILGSLLKKPATLMYPILPRQWQDNTRGHIQIDIDNCIFCGICMRKCPTDAIAVDRAAKAWTIQRMQCIQCCCCVELCPKKCLANRPEYTAPDVAKVVDAYEKPPEPPKEEPAAGA